LPVPWKDIRVVDERVRFIAAVKEDPRGNFAALCRRFGVHRSKGYKWLSRYRDLGPAGLEDRKPVALSCPHKTPDEVIDRVVSMRKEHPWDGPKKLHERLLALGDETLRVPAPSTIGEILGRYGLIRPRRARLRVPPHPSPLEPCGEPNDLWCVDFKGHFACGDGRRCHPLTITDAASRYLIKCEGLSEPKHGPTQRQFELAFREFGLPSRIRSDNGAPFATNSFGGLSRLSVWWIQLGIVPERIEPGQPQQNGRHERFHRTLKEQTTQPPAATLADQQRAFDRFRGDYNEHRPHQALGQTPPAAHYEPSLRPMPDRPRAPEYRQDFVVRRVRPNGCVSWRGVDLLVNRLLAGQPIGLRQTDDDEWDLHYGPLLLGYLLVRDGKARLERVA
jgi:transposase InsO family protein